MNDIQEVDSNPFEIEVNTPYSLNYLVFVQNIFLNSNDKNSRNPFFPYVDSSKWGILQNEEFEKTFKEIWNEVISKNRTNRLYDHNGILDFEKTSFKQLFEDNESGEFGYSESVKSFLAWWDGIYGKIAIGKVFDDDSMNKIYWKLTHSIKPTNDLTINRRLKIDLVYDKLRLVGSTASSWYLVLPIEDIFKSKSRPEVISKLLKCCEGI
jgi:hypothetical protein